MFSLILLFLLSSVIAKKLHMTAETAERWIVNLIRNARLGKPLDSSAARLDCSRFCAAEAKIDSERNRVEIASPSPNVYQQVLDKARNLVVRSGVLVQNVDRPATGTLGSTNAAPRGDFGNFRRGGPRGNNTLDFNTTAARGNVDFAPSGGQRMGDFGAKRLGNR